LYAKPVISPKRLRNGVEVQMERRKLCVIPGDGIGPEVTAAAVQVLQAATNDVEIVEASAGWQTFCDTGDSVPAETLAAIRECGAAFFGAVSSPSGKVDGYQSAILKIRQTLDLYANLRPVRSLWADGDRDDINLLIVRENSEGLYAGREQLMGDRAVAEKVVTRAASARIGRQAAAIAAQRSQPDGPRVTIVHKANVMPLSDGLFRDAVRQAVQACAAGIEIDECLVDLAAYRLAARPQDFQVLVTTNLYGDILSDLAAIWCGGMGRAPSLNLGDQLAVAEPVHGSAPDIAGHGIADPAAAILSLALLSRHYWQDSGLAECLEQATVAAIRATSAEDFSTSAFAGRVIECLQTQRQGFCPC
jgi:homoisocitrate dehydrogenase